MPGSEGRLFGMNPKIAAIFSMARRSGGISGICQRQTFQKLVFVANLEESGPAAPQFQNQMVPGKFTSLWIGFSAVLPGRHLESTRPTFTLNR
jgi:hypothetical protein